MIYDLNFFIRKYELIPANLFCPEMWGKDGAHCYMGHCGGDDDEQFPLANILWKNLHVSAAELVYGLVDEFQQPCLKERILAALYWIKSKEAVTEAEEIISDRPESHEERMAYEDRQSEILDGTRESFILNWMEGK